MGKNKKGLKVEGRKARKLVRGPKPEVIKIEGDWRKAVKKSLLKKKPKEGWPK